MRVVKVHEAKTHLSALLLEVENGNEIVIARGNTAVARLVPIDQSTNRDLGFVSYQVPDSFFEALPDDELDAWSTDL